MNKERKYRIPFRLYSTSVAIVSVCLAATVSLGLVLLAFRFFHSGPFTLVTCIALCFAVCMMTMVIGSFLIYHVMGHFMELIEPVNTAVERIATGRFDTEIPAISGDRQGAEYLHELDELRMNVNRMARELNGMDHMRKDFISNVSHEIKTPVAGLMGFAEMLLESDLTEEERREYLTLLYDESRRISRLCENMLRLSRLDNQSIVTRIKPVRVDEQIRKAVILLSENQTEREFDIDLPELYLNADEDLLAEVWINLIDNAMKYSEPDSIIHISGVKTEQGFYVSIRDEGCGIPAEKLAHIFEMFYQCEESHKKTGNGLGLAIVRRILELLGGSIECRSAEGKGTEMIVRFHS